MLFDDKQVQAYDLKIQKNDCFRGKGFLSLFEVSTNCCGSDNDSGDADQKIDMVDERQTTYPVSDVFRDASMTRFSADTTVTVPDILRNIESSDEDEFIGSQTTTVLIKDLPIVT